MWYRINLVWYGTVWQDRGRLLLSAAESSRWQSSMSSHVIYVVTYPSVRSSAMNQIQFPDKLSANEISPFIESDFHSLLAYEKSVVARGKELEICGDVNDSDSVWCQKRHWANIHPCKSITKWSNDSMWSAMRKHRRRGNGSSTDILSSCE